MNYIKCQELVRNDMFANLHHNGWHQSTNFVFAGNYMKYPDLHRKLTFATPHLSWGVHGVVKGSIYKTFLL